jgi:hypothetical protein
VVLGSRIAVRPASAYLGFDQSDLQGRRGGGLRACMAVSGGQPMTCRTLRAAVAVIAGAAVASIQIHAALAAKRAPSEYDELNNTPLLFYLAKGAPNACGPGCSEWIAAEGYFDAGAPERLRALLGRIGNRNLPVYFQSPGGFIDEAMVIGRFLRERQMTAGVARTIPDACAAKNVNACRAAKRSGQILNARFVGINAGCNSACVYALIGGRVRQVPPGARVGIHSSKLARTGGPPIAAPLADLTSWARLQTANAELRTYIQSMQIDDGLFRALMKVPHERVRILTRDEVAHYGIDTREFQETPWTFLPAVTPSTADSVVKMFSMPKGREHKFRNSMIQLTCRNGPQVTVHYVRALASDETEGRGAKTTRASISLVSGSNRLDFPTEGTTGKFDWIDPGMTNDDRLVAQDPELFDAVATRPTIEVIENDSPDGRKAPERTIKLSTAGLAEALAALRRSCTKAVGRT